MLEMIHRTLSVMEANGSIVFVFWLLGVVMGALFSQLVRERRMKAAAKRFAEEIRQELINLRSQ